MPHCNRRLHSRSCAQRWLLAAACCATVAATPVAAAVAPPAAYAPGRILVKSVPSTPPRARAATASAAGARERVVTAPHTRLLRLAPGVSVGAALRRLRGRSDVAWAVPDYRARAA